MDEMARVKEKSLNLLLEIDRICEKEQIKYYIYAGTLLGAVRHKGFIPWDDDIDVVMFRSDYSRFLKACDLYLQKDHYFLQTIESDPLTSNPWAKLHDRHTAFISGVRRAGTAEGINVDIFPIDNAPNNHWMRKMRGNRIDRLNFIYQYRFQQHFKRAGKKMRIFQTVIGWIPPWNEQKYKERYDTYLQKYNRLDTKYVVYLSNRKYARKVVPREWFGDGVRLQFEGYWFPAPVAYQKVLESLYGPDYMRLPPEEERKTVHGTKLVDTECGWEDYRGVQGNE